MGRGVRSLGVWTAISALLISGLAGGVAAQEDEGPAAEGAIWLLLPVSAKAVAMGRAMTAMPGAESVWWNPAGLAELDRDHLLLFRGEDLAGEATAASLAFGREGLGTLSVAYQLLDIGDQEFRAPDGTFEGTLSFRNHLGVVSLASRFWDLINVGLNLKAVQARSSCRGQCTAFGSGVTATTFAVDVGAQASEVGGLPLRLGLTVAHAGASFQFENEEQADPLPTRIRFGAAFEFLEQFAETDELRFWVSAEVEDRWRDGGDPAAYFGFELQLGAAEYLALRAGYVYNSDTQVDAPSVGLGLRYESIELGIAKSLKESSLLTDQEPVHISFGFLF